MIDTNKLSLILERYRVAFVTPNAALKNTTGWQRESFKWEAVKCFQDNWDINAEDFASMVSASIAKTDRLLVSRNSFPGGMLKTFAEVAPEELRQMFKELFDESTDVISRINKFEKESERIRSTYGEGKWKSHYQDPNTITTYLWLRYPDKYYIYKFSEIKSTAKELDPDLKIKKGYTSNNVHNAFKFYDEIVEYLKTDKETTDLVKSKLTDRYYSDPEYRTLAIDIGFFISRIDSMKEQKSDESGIDKVICVSGKEDQSETGYWWLNAKPKIWSYSEIAVGDEQAYTLYNSNGSKRRIFQNFLDVKAGDYIIGYESAPVKKIVALAKITKEQDGKEIYIEKTEGLSNPIDYKTLRTFPELENMEFFQNLQGSLFKLTKDEFDFIMDIIREENPASQVTEIKKYTKSDFLNEVYMTDGDYESLVALLKNKKNVILQGAPGVGKTFAAKRLAWSVMGEKDESRIEFVQFHQNYSYEDFMMGYKPTDDGFELKYGVFYKFCQTAANHPDKEYFFIIDEINRGNLSKIFGELLMLIEKDHRKDKTTLAYNGMSFSVPDNLYIIGMMNTADRSLAMIDYALRRRFSFFSMEPGFASDGFKEYRNSLNNEKFNRLVSEVINLNKAISNDKSLGKGFCIGHSYFCGCKEDNADSRVKEIVNYDIIPMLQEYWFDDSESFNKWSDILKGSING